MYDPLFLNLAKGMLILALASPFITIAIVRRLTIKDIAKIRGISYKRKSRYMKYE